MMVTGSTSATALSHSASELLKFGKIPEERRKEQNIMGFSEISENFEYYPKNLLRFSVRSPVVMRAPTSPVMLVLLLVAAANCARLDEQSNHVVPSVKKAQIFYQRGSSESSLPLCSPFSVCNKIDTYESRPWLERQCRCPTTTCSTAVTAKDGHSIVDRNKVLKLCEPVRKVKRCKHLFKEVSFSRISYPDKSTQQIVHCKCPKNSVAYMLRRRAFHTQQGPGFHYSFACSPQMKLRCKKREPCRLFSVRSNLQDSSRPAEVTTNSLCRCGHKSSCPQHHLDVGVIPSKTYSQNEVRTYTAFCL